MRPVIAVTSGEPAGIGPELCLRLATFPGDVQLVVIGDRNVLAERARLLGLNVAVRAFCPKNPVDRSMLDILHIPLATPSKPGQLDAANGPYVLAVLDRALAGCQSGEFAAMVTAPVHKGVINDAGFPFTGHTEYLAEKTATPLVVMMLAGNTERGPLRVALVTTHLPLKDVPAAITADVLEKTLRILHADLQHKYGLARPRILVAGLNPHAGEGGYLGREEIEIITPVLEKLRGEGMLLSGPHPADTVFHQAVHRKRFDAIVCMYHDQGHTPMKLLAFESGVNITIGLPVVRTSVDHGTAFDIAWQGVAFTDSLQHAIDWARKLVG